MKPKRTADLSLFLTVTGLLLASFAFVKTTRAQVEDTTKPLVDDTVLDNKVLSVVEKIPGLTDMMVRFTDYYEKDSIRAIELVDWIPKPHAAAAIHRKYYGVYLGEEYVDHTVRWYTFLLSKDLKKIFYYDVSSGKIYPISHWKKLWPATKFLKKDK